MKGGRAAVSHPEVMGFRYETNEVASPGAETTSLEKYVPPLSCYVLRRVFASMSSNRLITPPAA